MRSKAASEAASRYARFALVARDDRRLGNRSRDLLADAGNDVLVSVVSVWEIVIKLRIGKLRGNVQTILVGIERDGFVLLAIKPAHLAMLTTLPMHHRDPFDHLLMAQALAEDATFLSTDRHVPDYPVRSTNCAI